MSTIPTTPVQIWAFDDTFVQTTIFQLLQWKHALRLEINTGMTMSGGRKVSTHLRKLLKTPKRYRIEWLLHHIEESLKDITEQLETGDLNWQPTEQSS